MHLQPHLPLLVASGEGNCRLSFSIPARYRAATMDFPHSPIRHFRGTLFARLTPAPSNVTNKTSNLSSVRDTHHTLPTTTHLRLDSSVVQRTCGMFALFAFRHRELARDTPKLAGGDVPVTP